MHQILEVFDMAKNTISKINVNDEDYYLVDEEARNALQVMKGATSEEPGEAGIVPAPEVAPAGETAS